MTFTNGGKNNGSNNSGAGGDCRSNGQEKKRAPETGYRFPFVLRDDTGECKVMLWGNLDQKVCSLSNFSKKRKKKKHKIKETDKNKFSSLHVPITTINHQRTTIQHTRSFGYGRTPCCSIILISSHKTRTKRCC